MKKCIAIALMGLAIGTGPVSAKSVEIEPYSPKATVYEVDGKEMGAAAAEIEYRAGKTVKLCKALSGVQSNKTYRINGKEVKGSDLKSCDEQKLVETKTGTRFAKKAGR